MLQRTAQDTKPESVTAYKHLFQFKAVGDSWTNTEIFKDTLYSCHNTAIVSRVSKDEIHSSSKGFSFLLLSSSFITLRGE